MTAELVNSRTRYQTRFIAELGRRCEAIITASQMLRSSGLQTLPEEGSPGSDDLVHAVDVIYRHAHSVRGAAGTLGIEPAREVADILAEIALHLNEPGMLGDETIWELVGRGAHALEVYGTSIGGGTEPDLASLADFAVILRRDFEYRFAPPEDAVDDFAEVARVLRLSEEEIAAFRFPTEDLRKTTVQDQAPQTAEGAANQAPMAPVEMQAVESMPTAVIEVPDVLPVGANGAAEAMAAEAKDLETVSAVTPSVAPLEAASESGQVQTAEIASPVTASEPAPLASPVISRRVTIFCESSLRMLEQSASALERVASDRWDSGGHANAQARVPHHQGRWPPGRFPPARPALRGGRGRL